MRRVFLISSAVLFVVLIVVGVWLAGTPGEARAKRFDQARVQDLNAISNAVTNYYNAKNSLPVTVAELDAANQKAYNQTLNLKDPQTGKAYEYRVTGGSSGREFELCAEFNAAYKTNAYNSVSYGLNNNIWDHDAGRDCFTQTAYKYNQATQ